MLRPAKEAPAQKAHQENPMKALHYIGFDVHKKTISFCVKTAGGENVGPPPPLDFYLVMDAPHLSPRDFRGGAPRIYIHGSSITSRLQQAIKRRWWRRRESNLSAPFRFCNLLILQKEESAKRPTQACPSYNYRTILLPEKRVN